MIYSIFLNNIFLATCVFIFNTIFVLSFIVFVVVLNKFISKKPTYAKHVFSYRLLAPGSPNFTQKNPKRSPVTIQENKWVLVCLSYALQSLLFDLCEISMFDPPTSVLIRILLHCLLSNAGVWLLQFYGNMSFNKMCGLVLGGGGGEMLVFCIQFVKCRHLSLFQYCINVCKSFAL